MNIDSIVETEEDKLNDYFVEASSGVLDIEDMGGAIHEQKKELKGRQLAGQKGELAEMVTPRQRASLTKEGYKIIGTHSAVKLCRWTKISYVDVAAATSTRAMVLRLTNAWKLLLV